METAEKTIESTGEVGAVSMSPSTSLLCATCGCNVILVEGVTAVWSRGYWWCTHCFDVDSYRDGKVVVAFPSRGKLIPPTILTHNK
jgi:hypothetical protein